MNAKQHLVESDFLNKDSLESNASILCLIIAAFASKTIRFITANFISHYFHICKNSYASNLYSALHRRQRGRAREWENWMIWKGKWEDEGNDGTVESDRQGAEGGGGGPQQRGEERSKGRGKEWREETFTETAGAPLYRIWGASHLAVMQSGGVEGWGGGNQMRCNLLFLCKHTLFSLSFSCSFVCSAAQKWLHLIE